MYENLPPIDPTRKPWSSVLPSNSTSSTQSSRRSSLLFLAPRPFVPFHEQATRTASPLTYKRVESPAQTFQVFLSGCFGLVHSPLTYKRVESPAQTFQVFLSGCFGLVHYTYPFDTSSRIFSPKLMVLMTIIVFILKS